MPRPAGASVPTRRATVSGRDSATADAITAKAAAGSLTRTCTMSATASPPAFPANHRSAVAVAPASPALRSAISNPQPVRAGGEDDGALPPPWVAKRDKQRKCRHGRVDRTDEHEQPDLARVALLVSIREA